MAYSLSMTPHSLQPPYRDTLVPATQPAQQRKSTKLRFVTELSQCLYDFVIQLLPTPEESTVKEDVRKLLERLIRTIEPDSRLLSFGSTANGFSLRNSDMDLCCLIDSDDRLAATDLVTMLGDLLERETKFHVKPLPHARIPIVKLSLDPSPGLPLGIACDIGFENRLALENTRLLMCYAMIDPNRVRTMVLFLKVWSKRRKINSPYKGTLSSYGYVLLVIYFLVHVKNPPVLPNLQQMPPLRPISKEDTHLNGFNIWFFDDIELLRQRWHSENTETIAELLIDFFRYYSRDFPYNTGVASIRAGLLRKDSKGWQNDLSSGRYNDSRERNRFCIEDPFEIDFNVARCVTKDGLYTIRGEFMRATRVLATRPERAVVALAELCDERKDEDLVHAPTYVSHRPSLPPQTPYTVGSQSMRPKGAPAPTTLSPPMKLSEPAPSLSVQETDRPPPPDHMAPKRGRWTSPPPVEAPSADHTLFENQLGKGLELATSSSEARQREKRTSSHSSSSNSEHLTDGEHSEAAESDDITSVRSFTEGSIPASGSSVQRRPSWHVHDNPIRPAHFPFNGNAVRGKYPRYLETAPIPFRTPPQSHPPPARLDSLRRLPSHRPSRPPSWPSSTITPIAASIPLPSSPDPTLDPTLADSSAVYYQTTPRSPCSNVLYLGSGTLPLQYQMHHNRNVLTPPDIFPSSHPPSLMSNNNPRLHAGLVADVGRSSAGPETPTPASYSHSHSLSSTTIIPPTPPPHASKFSCTTQADALRHSASPRHRSRSPSQPQTGLDASSGSPCHSAQLSVDNMSTHTKTTECDTNDTGCSSPHLSSTSNSSSPAPSSTGYATSISRSPSPHSPSPPQTVIPPPPDEKPEEALLLPTQIQAPLAELSLVDNDVVSRTVSPPGR